ncbi:nucleoside hydrolase [Planctomicrobium sp. SH527]|uniref:nucleoside hydrolase n=1 Tax=Planctomicrobium sp. SH527 TaxID=3448123 RepID=UPI003F5BCA68
MSGKKVIIDADPGIGDAIAIALALFDPTLDVIAVTSTGGTVSGEQAYRNLQTIISLIDPPRWPRLGWCTSPRIALPDRPERTGILLHDGFHGLGDCEIIEALPHAPIDSTKLLVDIVREYPGEVTLLTLGPLTNVALAMERHPEFLQQLELLVSFGGSLKGQGNVTPAAEFNIYADPESARLILKSPATKILAPLDICSHFGLTFDQYDALEVDQFSRLGQFLSKSLPYALRESRIQLGREGLLLPEIAAFVTLVHPELFERQSLQLDVEVSGELTRGMTVFDRRGLGRHQPNIDVLCGIDSVGVRDYVTKLIRAAANP